MEPYTASAGNGGSRQATIRRPAFQSGSHRSLRDAAGGRLRDGRSDRQLDATTDEHADGIPVSVLKQLYEDWALLPGAIEETLRFYSPCRPRDVGRRRHRAWRAGRQCRVVGRWLAHFSNRDPDLFPNPSRFDIRRWPNEHLTFGDGRRRCLGAPLARLELTIALQVLLERLPGLRRDRTEPFACTYGTVDALERLPYSFADPGQWS
jgi:cytochrome P450